MATIQINKKDASNAEMNMTIRETESGRAYKIVLKRHHLEVTRAPKQDADRRRQSRSSKAKEKLTSEDWNDSLTDAEKAQLFTVILSEYRKRSLGDNGFKGAAIGAVDDKWSDGQTRLFIGTNTTRWASPYFKDCAEQNMVNAATDALNDLNAKKNAAPRAPKFKSIYVLQAKDDCTTPIACPCGKCTDMLARVMKNSESPVVTVPLPTPEQRKALETNTAAITINCSAKTLDGVLAQKPTHPNGITVWQTAIATLNSKRECMLTGDNATLQLEGFKRAVNEAAKPQALPKLRAEANVTTMSSFLEQSGDRRNPKSVMEFVGNFLASLRQTLRPTTPSQINKVVQLNVLPAEQAVKNVLFQRKSVAVLDCAEMNDGQTDIVQINQFLVDRITDTLADRMHTNSSLASLTAAEKRKEVIDTIDSIRCVAIQLDDGTFRYAVQVAGKNEASMPNAEVAALEQAAESLGRHVVRHVWAMEMNPKDIKKHILRTSPKEGVERLMKRAGADGIDFHYLPFNTGNLDEIQLKSAMLHLTASDIYPSTFKGKHQSSTMRSAAKDEHFSWEAWAAQLKAAPQKAETAPQI